MATRIESPTPQAGSASLNGAVLRGVAILSIILHNYCHVLKGAIFENEFTYQSWHVSKLLNYLAHPNIYLPLQLLSFFGHYGVVIFVFLSAYGLEKKYGHSTQEVPIIPFIWTHYLKLLSMCISGYAAYLLLNAYYTDYPSSVIFGVLSQLSMLSNLQIFNAETFAPGPYWYFGLTFQLYVLYRLFFFPPIMGNNRRSHYLELYCPSNCFTRWPNDGLASKQFYRKYSSLRPRVTLCAL